MSKSRSHKHKNRSNLSRRIARWSCGLILLAVLLALLVALLIANIVHVRRAEIYLSNLPAVFDGITLLYASDIDLGGINTAEKCAALFSELKSLHPDVLLLGGDYNAHSLLSRFRTDRSMDEAEAEILQREALLESLADFPAPMGKFAISCPDEPDLTRLHQALEDADFQPLFNDRFAIRQGNETLWILGVGSEGNLNRAADSFLSGDCVILLAYSPAVFPNAMIAEASDGGPWVDLALAGHTHGGQIHLLGQSALRLTRQEQQYLYGWKIENGCPMLTTSGVGCEALNLRLGSQAEVWLLTLRSSDLSGSPTNG